MHVISFPSIISVQWRKPCGIHLSEHHDRNATDLIAVVHCRKDHQRTTHSTSYRVGQKQIDDLNLAPCRHLCRWRGKTHRCVKRFETFSVGRNSIERLLWKCFFKKQTPLLQRGVFFDILTSGGIQSFRHAKQY
jgi:hypothetical protein